MSNELVGQVFAGQFRIDSLITTKDSGSSCRATYKGFDLSQNVPVALKVLPETHPGWSTVLQQRMDELRSLNHPNLLPYFGVYHTKTISFIVRNYIEGLTLQGFLDQITKQPTPTGKILSLLKIISSALGYIHEHGVTHANLKPSNIMIDPDGTMYLADFGFSPQISEGVDPLSPVGSPFYLAPEQFMHKPVTPAADIYAMGVILYELFTRQKMFTGNHPVSSQAGKSTWERIRFEHLRMVPPDPVAYNRDLSPQVADVILKALEKNPNLRHHKILHLYEDLCQACKVFPESVPERVLLEGMPASPAQSAVFSSSPQITPTILQTAHPAPGSRPASPVQPDLWERPIKRKVITTRSPQKTTRRNPWLIGLLIFTLLVGIFGITTITLLIINFQ